jgi:hypothetical protein
MDQEFLTFQKFNSKDLVSPLIHLLEQNKIAYEIEDSAYPFNPASLNGNSTEEYAVKIHPDNFETAHQLLMENAKQNIHLQQNHYLRKFSDPELYDIILKPDEWSRNDYVMAQVILKERGKEVNEDLIAALRTQRIEDLSKPEKGNKYWIIGGYVFSLLGGLIGILIGIHLYTYKKTLPDGTRLWAYEANDRNHGIIMAVTGLVIFVLMNVLKILLGPD